VEEQAMEAQSSESTGLNFEKVWAMFQETIKENERQRQESERRRQEQLEEDERRWQEERKETLRILQESKKELDRKMGDLGRKFGIMIEHMMIPNMIEKFRQLGYVFEKSSPNVLIQDEKNEIYAQIDLFLENGDSAMVVEVKVQPNTGDIREHVERMEKLRQYADLHHDGRALFGALAGAIIPKNVRDYALKQGLYIIEQSGDTVNIIAPPGKPKAW
jgi:hypothetical protein